MEIKKTKPTVVAIPIARDLSHRAEYVIHWRPEEALPEFDDYGRPQQYAIVYPAGVTREGEE